MIARGIVFVITAESAGFESESLTGQRDPACPPETQKGGRSPDGLPLSLEVVGKTEPGRGDTSTRIGQTGKMGDRPNKAYLTADAKLLRDRPLRSKKRGRSPESNRAPPLARGRPKGGDRPNRRLSRRRDPGLGSRGARPPPSYCNGRLRRDGGLRGQENKAAAHLFQPGIRIDGAHGDQAFWKVFLKSLISLYSWPNWSARFDQVTRSPVMRATRCNRCDSQV